MKNFLYSAIALLLIGCQQAAPTPEPTKAPEPVKTTPVTTPEPKKDEGKAPEPPKAKPGDIAERLYQLRDLAKVTIKTPAHPVNLWIMDTESKEAEGMMYLTDKEVKDDEGMIFVFADSAPRSFWMQNTLLALDIIYIGPDGKVLNIAGGRPRDESSLPSAGNAMYVIELKQGQAAKCGIKPGTILEIPKSVKVAG